MARTTTPGALPTQGNTTTQQSRGGLFGDTATVEIDGGAFVGGAGPTGPAGPVGPAGPMGNPGTDGLPGRMGNQGQPGPAIDRTETASSSPDGFTTVEFFVGTDNVGSVNLPDGTTGPMGNPGTPGADGTPGEDGIGTMGAPGNPVDGVMVTQIGSPTQATIIDFTVDGTALGMPVSISQGSQGLQGDRGEQGNPGAAVDGVVTNTSGSPTQPTVIQFTVAGNPIQQEVSISPGPRGPDGPAGPMGDDGTDGTDGAPVDRATAGTQNPDGTLPVSFFVGTTNIGTVEIPQGPPGLTGPPGPKGDQGAAGTGSDIAVDPGTGSTVNLGRIDLVNDNTINFEQEDGTLIFSFQDHTIDTIQVAGLPIARDVTTLNFTGDGTEVVQDPILPNVINIDNAIPDWDERGSTIRDFIKNKPFQTIGSGLLVTANDVLITTGAPAPHARLRINFALSPAAVDEGRATATVVRGTASATISDPVDDDTVHDVVITPTPTTSLAGRAILFTPGNDFFQFSIITTDLPQTVRVSGTFTVDATVDGIRDTSTHTINATLEIEAIWAAGVDTEVPTLFSDQAEQGVFQVGDMVDLTGTAGGTAYAWIPTSRTGTAQFTTSNPNIEVEFTVLAVTDGDHTLISFGTLPSGTQIFRIGRV